MKYDPARFVSGLKGAYEELAAHPTGGDRSTHNRMTASVKYVLDEVSPSMSTDDVFGQWLSRVTGSSTLMLVHWMQDTHRDRPNEFVQALQTAQGKLMENFREPPKPIGICWAFATASAVADGRPKREDNAEVLRVTAEIIELSGNTDPGVRAFFHFLKGFVAGY